MKHRVTHIAPNGHGRYKTNYVNCHGCGRFRPVDRTGKCQICRANVDHHRRRVRRQYVPNRYAVDKVPFKCRFCGGPVHARPLPGIDKLSYYHVGGKAAYYKCGRFAEVGR